MRNKYNATPTNNYEIIFNSDRFYSIASFCAKSGLSSNSVFYRIKQERKKSGYMKTNFNLKIKEIEFEVNVVEVFKNPIRFGSEKNLELINQ
jgi:hypothetical protein